MGRRLLQFDARNSCFDKAKISRRRYAGKTLDIEQRDNGGDLAKIRGPIAFAFQAQDTEVFCMCIRISGIGKSILLARDHLNEIRLKGKFVEFISLFMKFCEVLLDLLEAKYQLSKVTVVRSVPIGDEACVDTTRALLIRLAISRYEVQFLQQLQPEWSRFVTIVKQAEKIDIVSYHRLFDILKQFQLEVNDIRAERIAKSANPLALIAAAQPYSDTYYQEPKLKNQMQTSFPKTSTGLLATKAKMIAKPINTALSRFQFLSEDSDPNMSERQEMQNEFGTLCKVFQELTPNYQQQPSNFFKLLGTRLKIPHRYNNDNQVKASLGIKARTVLGARGNSRQSGSAQQMEQCLTARDMGTMQRNCGKHKVVLKTSGVYREIYMAKIQDVSPEESGSTGQPLEQIPYDTSDPANRFAPDREETWTLIRE
ncbi:hypothetical protein Tco_0008550 [Tanacetum coccineum]